MRVMSGSNNRIGLTIAAGMGFLAALLVLAPLLLAPRAWAAKCRTVESCVPQLRFGETRQLRELAAQQLGERGDSAAIPSLVAVLSEDEGEFVRLKAAEALGRLGTEKAIDPLVNALANDRSEVVRATAAMALGATGNVKGAEALASALSGDTEWRVRSAAAKALGAIGVNPAAVEALSGSLLNDGRREVRIDVAGAIARLKDQGNVEAMVRALTNDLNARVRISVA